MHAAEPDSASGDPRSGLWPFVACAVLLAAGYAGWLALGARDPGDPFGAWSDAAQVAPGPPRQPEPAGEVLPSPLIDDDDDSEP